MFKTVGTVPSFCILLAESFRRGKKQEHLSQLGNVCFSGSFTIIILQGGSDKSGILQIFLKNCTAQLKISRFYYNKTKMAEAHIKNQLFLALKLFEPFAMVSLSRDSITSMIFEIGYTIML